MKTNKNLKRAIILVLAIIVIAGVSYFINQAKNEKGLEIKTEVKKDDVSFSDKDKSNEYLKKYNTLFTKEFKEPANFGENVRIVSVGCGSECLYLFALDKNTGKVFNLLDYYEDKNIISFKSYEISTGPSVKTILSDGTELFFYTNSYGDFESSNILPGEPEGSLD